VRLRFQFRRYRLPFRAVVRTAHGPWEERQGLFVRLENETGAAGLGEAAPVPGFGTETVDEDEAACRALGEWTDTDALAALPVRLASLRHAIAAARGDLERASEREPQADVAKGRAETPRYLGVAALLPAGRAALAQIAPKADIGFRVFKWKVGVGDLADELALLDDVCAALPSGGKLRLDANGAWDHRKAQRWLERCADRPVEFVEQPCLAHAADGATAQRRIDDALLGLANDYPTPIALDESLVGDGDIARWLGAGWRGVFVIKPALLADQRATMATLARAKADVVFSSALETAIGARAGLRLAFEWAAASGATAEQAPTPGAKATTTASRPPRALGFGVWPLFADSRFDGPASAPFVRVEDVERINPEAIWTALS
jgi:o-succinylbenzoate synthase